jgi:multisubunit Na+/H+ antiporter MnhG subunit
MTARTTARGIGLRALLLAVGILLVAGWLFLKIAGAAIHLLLWIGFILIVAAVVAMVARKVRRR